MFELPEEFGEDKLANAISSYVSLLKGEEILCIHDSTLWGGAKEGVCFTNYGIRYKILGRPPIYIKYKNIKSIVWLQNDSDEIILNNYVLECVDDEQENIVNLLKEICPDASYSNKL
jgi:hypothetical protein